MFRAFLSVCLLLVFYTSVCAAETYQVDYRLRFDVKADAAQVHMQLRQSRSLVREMDFDMPSERYSAIEFDGEHRREGSRVIWTVPETGGSMRYTVAITRTRSNGAYDARMTSDWALFRGDRVFPAARVVALRGAESESRLRFDDLPEGWSVETRYSALPGGWRDVVEPERRFRRPTGWMIAGELGVRRDRINGMEVVVASPRGESMRRQDILAFLNWILPEADIAFGGLPAKFLIVGADDPMWRGGLSGPYSMYLHSDRPMVSENGTSTLIHEMTHSLTRIVGARFDNWITEGIAEFYTFELLHRAGGSTAERYQRTLDSQRERGRGINNLRVQNSKGRTTSRAVTLFLGLDQEIREATDGEQNLDDLVRRLMLRSGTVTTEDLREVAEALIGKPSQVLDSRLLRRRED